MLWCAVNNGSVASSLHALPALVERRQISSGRNAFNLGGQTRASVEASPRLLVLATPVRLHVIEVLYPQLRLIPGHLSGDDFVIELTEPALHVDVLFREVNVLLVLLISAQRLHLNVLTGDFPEELTDARGVRRHLLA